MQSAGVLILGHPLIACMLLILFAYFLKRAFIDFYFIFLSECADPVLFKFRLIVARDSTAHVGNFFGSIDYSSVIAEPSYPFSRSFRTFTIECHIVDNCILAFACHHAFEFYLASEIFPKLADK